MIHIIVNYLEMIRGRATLVNKFILGLVFISCLSLDTFSQTCPTGSGTDPFTSFDQAHSATTSGRYYFNINNQFFSANVDTSEGGGWVLILQYIHQGGTNPNLFVFNTGNFPLISNDNDVLGTDGSQNGNLKWGHVSNSFLNSITGYDELRFYGETSAHNRKIHFKTTTGLNYIKTGTGDFSGLATNFTPLTGHTANLPAQINSQFPSKGDFALTEFPFYKSGANHWGIKGLTNRWEVDDYPNGNQNHTIHRVWIRSSTASSCLNTPPSTPQVLSCSDLLNCFNYSNSIGLSAYHFGNQNLVANGTNPNYALLHEDDGTTHLNAAGNKPIILSHNQERVAIKLDYSNTNIYAHLYVTKDSIGAHSPSTKQQERLLDGTLAHFDGRVYISEEDALYSNDNDTEKGLNFEHPAYKSYLLWVEKGIVTTNLIYADVNSWPDNVFEKEYPLTSLKDLQEFIKANGHLPTIPSAKDVLANGFEAVDMTQRLVQTTEELTLHIIKQQDGIMNRKEKIKTLNQNLVKQDKTINEMDIFLVEVSKRLNALEKMK